MSSMKTILPIITVTDLQRNTKKALASVRNYAVVQSHGKDVAIVLAPRLGHLILQSDNLRDLLVTIPDDENVTAQLDRIIGNVIHELSKK